MASHIVLHALAFLSTFISDRDSALFSAFLQGVPTGFYMTFNYSIALLHVLFANDICSTNWQGAENDLLSESLSCGRS